jgi:hypothetical protein
MYHCPELLQRNFLSIRERVHDEQFLEMVEGSAGSHEPVAGPELGSLEVIATRTARLPEEKYRHMLPFRSRSISSSQRHITGPCSGVVDSTVWGEKAFALSPSAMPARSREGFANTRSRAS